MRRPREPRADMKTTAELLFDYLGDMLSAPEKASLDIDALPPEFRDLGNGLCFLAEMLGELRAFAQALGQGNLSVPPPRSDNELASPLKNLQASLRHLTWQSQQVAKGDYKQRVDFMGEFAHAFNAMTRQLAERRENLLQEIENGRRKTLALEQNIALFEALTNHAPQCIFVIDRETRDMLLVNNAARAALDAGPGLADALWRWLESWMNEPETGNAPRRVEEAKIVVSGITRHFSLDAYPVAWGRRNAIVLIAIDRSAEYARMKELEGVAYHDPLTQTASRHYGMKVLDDWTRAGHAFCVCFVDMDNLKYVNDVFGHPAGDAYIVSVARLLSGFSRDALVCRLGGDEFMLLQRGWSEARVEARMAELRGELAKQNAGPGRSYTRSISYGVIETPGGGAAFPGALLAQADEKMYHFKRAHKKQRGT